jgi:molecular chaperone DnaK
MNKTVDYGIDLGTTNSCIARWEGGSVRVFQNNDQMNVTPSAVHILKTGRVIVGRRAYAALLGDSENVSIEFKRWMGQKDRKRFPAAQRELSAEELSAEVLKSLREDVRRQTGADVNTAVITVPAAFGALQCEATARAAELAGLQDAPLLQEPIAAAIGYGARPGSANQRWMVFDLGGGTLDIAVVSTREGRLNVLEHRGNNLLGGKDIDRSIVEHVLFPAIEASYDLRASGPGAARSALLPRLRIKAEEAKIDLSTDTQVVVSLFDLGKDDSGESIEMEVSLTRPQLEGLMEPLLEKCCILAKEALAGARLAGADLDHILLVGGPTQSPLLRAMLTARLGAPVDFSADPMTVVGRGAAVYASTLETKNSTISTTTTNVDCVHLKLAYDPVSAELHSTVAGRVGDATRDIELRLDSEDGLWTSGWMKLKGGFFEISVPLKEGDITTFWVYARDGRGQLLETDTPEFRVRHGLVPSAPPLPHTLSVEVLTPGGKPALDSVFAKGTPLPADKTVKYRAIHALAPDKPDSDIAIKLWEGEYLDDPDANEWVGNVSLRHDGVRRPVPEGAEIEVTIRVDASRKTTVDAFVPHLNQHFSGHLYVAQREEQDFSNLSRTVASETQTYRERLEELERTSSDESTHTELEEIRRDLDDLDARAPSSSTTPGKADPDDARRIVEDSKTVRGRLGRLERRAAADRRPVETIQFAELVEMAEQVVGQFGSSIEKQQLAMLRRELERSASKGDGKAIQRASAEIEALRWRVLFKHDWFWREIFDSLCQPNTPFVNPAEARTLITKGQAAVSGGDGEGLRGVVRSLWNLQPKGNAEASRERAVRSGLRKF